MVPLDAERSANADSDRCNPRPGRHLWKPARLGAGQRCALTQSDSCCWPGPCLRYAACSCSPPAAHVTRTWVACRRACARIAAAPLRSFPVVRVQCRSPQWCTCPMQAGTGLPRWQVQRCMGDACWRMLVAGSCSFQQLQHTAVVLQTAHSHFFPWQNHNLVKFVFFQVAYFGSVP